MSISQSVYNEKTTPVVEYFTYLKFDTSKDIIHDQLNRYNGIDKWKGKSRGMSKCKKKNKSKKCETAYPSNGFNNEEVKLKDMKIMINEKENCPKNEETDSLVSLETVSDNVSVWVDGEKHWVSGVDSNTTCADLICALLNYQNEQQQSNGFTIGTDANCNKTGTTNSNNAKNGNISINQRPLAVKGECVTNTNTNKIQIATAMNGMENGNKTPIQMTDFVIVKQFGQSEEYLNGNIKIFNVFSSTSAATNEQIPTRKECELILRRLVSSPQVTTHVSSLDKDSGMGSPMGSSRSTKYRRKKHSKSSSTRLAQGNTIHPKVSQRNCSSANERLLKMILAQDQTIHRQLTLLREKEHQINCIEDEKHRVRERELGKNYLLETYLNGLDVADANRDSDEEIEIFIDEPYLRLSNNLQTIEDSKESDHDQIFTLVDNNEYTSKEEGDATTDLLESKKKLSYIHRKREGIADTVNADSKSPNETQVSQATQANELSNRKEMQMQIEWLEKVCAINKQLQREEELLLKLYAKIRKHHVKRAYQTKREVLYQIDKLDSELALQYTNVRKVETNLIISNEQLREKLCVLEQLSQQFLGVSCSSTKEANPSDAVSFSDSKKIPKNPENKTGVTKLLTEFNKVDQENPQELKPNNPVHAVDSIMSEILSPPLGTITKILPTSTIIEQNGSNSLSQVSCTPEDLFKIHQLISKPVVAGLVRKEAQVPLLETASPFDEEFGRQNYKTSSFSVAPRNEEELLADLNPSYEFLMDHRKVIIDKNTLPVHINNPKNIQKQLFASKYGNSAGKFLSIQHHYQKTNPQTQPTSHQQCLRAEHNTIQLLSHSDITHLGTLV